MTQQEDGSKVRTYYIAFAVIAVVAVAAVVFFPTILAAVYSPEKPGEFGDQYGALNTLFSGLAFAGVILAIFLQREDLRVSREELRKSAEAQHLQVESLTIASRIDRLTTLIEATRARIDGLANRRTGLVSFDPDMAALHAEQEEAHEAYNELLKQLIELDPAEIAEVERGAARRE